MNKTHLVTYTILHFFFFSSLYNELQNDSCGNGVDSKRKKGKKNEKGKGANNKYEERIRK